MDLVMAEEGVLLSYQTELRQLIYLSDAVADRVEKRKKALELAKQKAQRQTRG